MPSLRLCSDDPVLTVLRETFEATPIRVPESRFQPLCVVSRSDRARSFVGALSDLLDDSSATSLAGLTVGESQMADLSGRETRSVSLSVGLDVLDGFLRGFHVP